MTSTGRQRYEILVRTRVSRAALARLRIALTPTAVPRKTVYRLRVPADCDITDVVGKLTERDVQLLDVRRFTERPPSPRSTGDATGSGAAEVIVPFGSAAGPAGAAVTDPRTGQGGGTAQVLPLIPRAASGEGRSLAADDARSSARPRRSSLSAVTVSPASGGPGGSRRGWNREDTR